MIDHVDGHTAPNPDLRDSRYAWYVVGLLTVIYSLSFIDRQVVNLLVEPIKAEFGLSDSQISLLQGLAFTSSYIALGPLFGRWADIGNRRNVIIFGAVVWSIFTVLCGLSAGYPQLFGARMGVGAAEACLIPAVYSMLPDYFRKETLPRAMSIFLMGPYIGGGLALIFGGIVISGFAGAGSTTLPLFGDLAPWQLVFVVVGMPGILLALTAVTISDPPRLAERATDSSDHFSWGDSIQYFWRYRAVYGCLFGGMSLHILLVYALPAWVPSFLARTLKIELSTIGFAYGALVLTMGMAGTLSGPLLGTWLRKKGYGDAPFRVPVIAATALVPSCALLPLAPNYETVLVVLALVTFLYTLPLAMATAALQLITPNRMRGIAASVYVFVVSAVGLGLAPTTIAATTDYIFRDPAMVGWSLGIVCSVASAGAAFVMYRGLGHFRAAMQSQAIQLPDRNQPTSV